MLGLCDNPLQSGKAERDGGLLKKIPLLGEVRSQLARMFRALVFFEKLACFCEMFNLRGINMLYSYYIFSLLLSLDVL